ncbi:hypothetical protein [Psychroserpens luteus]|uniref:Outer membrane protein beta-barrel domain-containing protein n=1 Tax=Psychroserpens luteus TaxID=1434066 RepID=A0ABW5ZYI7_9FLAO|nr:hypothetical protein [Psychroserpens luteus]
MKNVIVIILLFSCGLSFGQSMTKSDYRNSQDRWILSVGINALGNLGTQNPVERLDEFSLKQPFALAIEHRWSKYLSIEQDFSFNGYDAQTRIDNGILTEDILYFSTNTSLKYYFSDNLFDANWVDLYASGGIGIFSIDELNTSVNLSAGALFWINGSRTIGFRIQSTGKFAFNHSENQYDNNHWQHFLQAVFRL